MLGRLVNCLRFAVYMSATLPWDSQNIEIALVQVVKGENDSCIELRKTLSASQIIGVTYIAMILARRDRGKRVSPHVSNYSTREIFSRKNLPIASQKSRRCKLQLKTEKRHFGLRDKLPPAHLLSHTSHSLFLR